MAKNLFSLNINKSLQELVDNFPVEGVITPDSYQSVTFEDVDLNNPLPGQSVTDYVKASTGGIFYGKLLYDITTTEFSGKELPTAEWVLAQISSGVTPPDYNSLFDTRFATKSIADLAAKDHSLLTNILGNGAYHLSQTEQSRVTTAASSTTDGYLTQEDWTTFNNKLDIFTVGTGLSFDGSVLNLVLGQIDHNQLKNYNLSRHPELNDTTTTASNVWSASKIVNYVSSQIPVIPTDFVSQSNGGTFNGIISYNESKTFSSSLEIINKEYVDTSLSNLEATIYSTISGTGENSVKTILNRLSLLDIGTRNHNDLQNINLDGSGAPYHVNSTQIELLRNKATSTNDGYLSKEDWVLFNSKLGSFSVSLDINQNDFLRYDSGIMYYNPTKLDHNALFNYNEQNHPLLDDNITTESNVWSAAKIMSMLTGNDFQSYRINLKSGATVAQRLVGLVEGQDYPTGWTLAADGNALIITHNLNNVASVVNVFSVNGITSDAVKLEGNVAYSTLTNLYINDGYNAIRLDAFATVTTELIIKIIL